MQQDIDNLSEWSQKWQLHFNTEKCKIMHLGNNNNRETYQMNRHRAPKFQEIISIPPLGCYVKSVPHLEFRVWKDYRPLSLLFRVKVP